jgi:hypothetical protein
VQVKKARKSGKGRSQKTQVSISKKLGAFQVAQRKVKGKKLKKVGKSEKR